MGAKKSRATKFGPTEVGIVPLRRAKIFWEKKEKSVYAEKEEEKENERAGNVS